MHNKFIIESGVIIMGRVDYHKDLLLGVKEDVNGGGWYTREKSNNGKDVVTFYGKSEDFGMADLEDIKKCIDNKKVNWFGGRDIYDMFIYRYNTETEIIDL